MELFPECALMDRLILVQSGTGSLPVFRLALVPGEVRRAGSSMVENPEIALPVEF